MVRRVGGWQRAAIASGLALLVAGCAGGAGSAAAPPSPTLTPTPTATATPPRTPTPTPTPSVTATETEDAREAELEELRATNRFLELAEADRARNATWARFGYHQFAPHADGEVLFEWANKEELWNSIAPKIRDECLLAGPEATRPMWDAQVVIPASIDPAWNDETTGGRGQLIEFICSYVSADDQPVDSVWGVLIAADQYQEGEVESISPPLVITEEDYADFAQSRDAIDEFLWEWVISRPSERES